ncbi:MAG: type II toxin-antitoxin system PemK/MazF family toxin [Marinobacter sp.]|uniref:type II toxin-antitoxin system PemK/MazF family toxin n=1 Tax=Marinobacter sp. TaxID=50741 RepID=UPI00299D9312|nr:type II toxin-antitoxin system PemK/MazF family toxin [Marinobacter sp.]MDX1636023.1 type II toxin-antitoxin system PemK/MazF family toxin [Marinobacter sp.]
MEPFKKGSVILVRFPFSDLSSEKLRPAVIIANVGQGDFILCQVTSRPYDARAIELRNRDFATGSLQRVSYARPGKLFTANSSIFLREVGELDLLVVERLTQAVIDIVLG